MSKHLVQWALCLAVTGLVTIGCDEKKDETTVTPPPTPAPVAPATPTPSMNDTTQSTMDAAKDAGANAADKMKDAGHNAMDAGHNAMDAAGNKMSDMKNNMTDMKNNMSTSTPSMNDVNAMSATDVQKTADDLIAKVKTYIGENKLDDANSTLTKLEEMKSKLPASYQDQIAKLRQMFDAAKNGMKMPSMPAMK